MVVSQLAILVMPECQNTEAMLKRSRNCRIETGKRDRRSNMASIRSMGDIDEWTVAVRVIMASSFGICCQELAMR